uniref:NR LBD domain-containing protein n=1 Tax=Caenorhabditis tropicalis TaxID=1561998 RepID=A0A1I7TL72_9PELO
MLVMTLNPELTFKICWHHLRLESLRSRILNQRQKHWLPVYQNIRENLTKTMRPMVREVRSSLELSQLGQTSLTHDFFPYVIGICPYKVRQLAQ